MSYRVKTMIPVIIMLFSFGYVVVALNRSGAQEIRQPLPPALDLAAAKLIEIRDAGGQVVLNGNMITTETERDGDIERIAPLVSTGVIADAKGKAEIEVSTERNGMLERDLEVEVYSLAAGTSYNLFIDGQQIASFSTNGRGAAELEMR